MEQMISALLVWTTVLLVIVALFMIFRHVVLWYYCINERIANQRKIIENQQNILKQQQITNYEITKIVSALKESINNQHSSTN